MPYSFNILNDCEYRHVWGVPIVQRQKERTTSLLESHLDYTLNTSHRPSTNADSRNRPAEWEDFIRDNTTRQEGAQRPKFDWDFATVPHLPIIAISMSPFGVWRTPPSLFARKTACCFPCSFSALTCSRASLILRYTLSLSSPPSYYWHVSFPALVDAYCSLVCCATSRP